MSKTNISGLSLNIYLCTSVTSSVLPYWDEFYALSDTITFSYVTTLGKGRVLLAIVQKHIQVHPGARPIRALGVISYTIK